MMDPTKRDAETMLTDAGSVETAVRARAPREYPLYVGMGLTILLIGLAVDLNDIGGMAGVGGAALVMVAITVTVATNLAYLRRHRQVRIRTTPMWVEWSLGLWSVAAVFALGNLLGGSTDFSYAVGGLVGAIPFLLWAQRLRRTA